MKPRVDETAQRLLTLIKLDAKRLYERIRYRAPEYLFIFSSKRTREHFKEVFKNRYKDVRIEDLKMVGQEVIIALDEFYSLVDEIHWYVNSTEDMPGTVDDKVNKWIVKLTPVYQKLCLYIDADLGTQSEEVESAHLNMMTTLAGVDESDEVDFEMSSDEEFVSEEFGDSESFGEEETFGEVTDFSDSSSDFDLEDELPTVDLSDFEDDDIENVS